MDSAASFEFALARTQLAVSADKSIKRVRNSAVGAQSVRNTKLTHAYGWHKLVLMFPSAPAGAGFIRGEVSFQTTHWSVVLAAREQNAPASVEALARLCTIYWLPLYAFVRRSGASPEDAEDLTQEFFYEFLERDSLKYVQPGGGRFRSFLLACLKHFLANQRERACAQRRGGGQLPISLDASAAETHYLLEPADNVTPELLFERRWAFTVLQEALAQLRRDYIRLHQGDLFEALQGFLPGTDGKASRADIAAQRGMSVGAVDVAIHRLRQRFGAVLREQVAQTVSSPEEVQEEIRYLMSVLEC